MINPFIIVMGAAVLVAAIVVVGVFKFGGGFDKPPASPYLLVHTVTVDGTVVHCISAQNRNRRRDGIALSCWRAP